MLYLAGTYTPICNLKPFALSKIQYKKAGKKKKTLKCLMPIPRNKKILKDFKYTHNHLNEHIVNIIIQQKEIATIAMQYSKNQELFSKSHRKV